MTKDRETSELGYRPCVGVMLVNSTGEVFVGRRIDTKEGDFWQMPQGGIDEGEDSRDAALRELWEETGVTAEKVAIIGQTAESYILTPRLVGGRIGLHPVWIIFALLAGGALLGFTGVLLAVPMAAIIGVLLRFGLKRYRASSLYSGVT